MPISLFPDEPTQINYVSEWTTAARLSPEITLSPFTAKALYSFGMMRHLIESAGWSLAHNPPYQSFYIAAFLLSCGAVELLGRCVNGDAKEGTGATDRLLSGLREVGSIPHDNKDNRQVVVVTNHKEYSVADCAALRNFCAHGGSVGNISLDVELVDDFLKHLSEALDRYWARLKNQTDQDAREKLANAAVAPLFSGPGPNAIFIADLYHHVSRGLAISENLMFREYWHTYR